MAAGKEETTTNWAQVEQLRDVDRCRPTQDETGPFCFVQAADSQFGLIDRYLRKLDTIGWEDEMASCEQLIGACSRMEPKPKFIVICGDLLDAWPATDMRRRQVADFKRVFAKLNPEIPLVCVCGNHDVGDEPTMAALEEYKRDFGQDYYYFIVQNVLFIVINSQFYKHREFVKDYAEQQDDWLDVILAKCKQFKHSIVFEHIPWFLKEANEEDDEYFNISRETRLFWLNKFSEAGVSKIMCGHYHRNAGGWFQGMEVVVTSAIGAQLGPEQSGARVVKVSGGKIEHRYYAMADLPSHIDC